MNPAGIDRALRRVCETWGLELARLDAPDSELSYLITIPASVVGVRPSRIDRPTACAGCGAAIAPWSERTSCRYCGAPFAPADQGSGYDVRIRFYVDAQGDYVHDNTPDWDDVDEDAWTALAKIDVDLARRLVAESVFFESFQQVRCFLRERFSLVRDDDGAVAVDFVFGEPEAAASARRQRVEVVDYSVGDEAWLLLRCPILTGMDVDPAELLARNDVLPWATIGRSEDGSYRLYYTVPLELLNGGRVLDWVEEIAATADELEEEWEPLSGRTTSVP
ncbi:MAG TPA: hypothetical protein PLI95_31005 [Polyangiaceae bacterium]|nr:hypothetical protein [Polyangiaceae bacterium]